MTQYSQSTTLPPPPQGPPQSYYSQPRPSRGRVLTIIVVIVGMIVLGAAVAGCYFLGANSRDSEVKSAEERTSDTEATLEDTETDLEDVEVALDSVQDDLDDAQAQIAACDVEGATRVFNDVLGGWSEFLDQYSDYLDSSDYLFFADWDAVDRRSHGWHYNGRNTYPKRFDDALAACAGADPNNA
jgi:hypothetical protein